MHSDNEVAGSRTNFVEFFHQASQLQAPGNKRRKRYVRELDLPPSAISDNHPRTGIASKKQYSAAFVHFPIVGCYFMLAGKSAGIGPMKWTTTRTRVRTSMEMPNL